MSFTGNYVDATTALAWGLVNEVVAHDELGARARQLAIDIASIRTTCEQEIRSIYDEVADRTGDDARQFESLRSRTWMTEQFDRAQLASDRETIVRRGSSQVS
jgi:enoyl-CoA hydratase